jgi:hypothetical protein
MLLAGIVLGILFIVGWLQLARAVGQGMTGPMGSMMGQMMGPQSMADMMTQMMHDPKFIGSMASACAEAMKDPGVLRSMQDAMDNPEVRQLMEQMLDIMQRR